MGKKLPFLKVGTMMQSPLDVLLSGGIGSALIQACEAAGANIPRYVLNSSIRLNAALTSPLGFAITIGMSAFISLTQVMKSYRYIRRLAIAGNCRYVYIAIISFFGCLTVSRSMCLVEVERSPKPVASW